MSGVCGEIKVREETFTDLVLPVPSAEQVRESGTVPTMQKLLFQKCLKCEEMDACPRASNVPGHRFAFNMQTYDFTKEKTQVCGDMTSPMPWFQHVSGCFRVACSHRNPLGEERLRCSRIAAAM